MDFFGLPEWSALVLGLQLIWAVAVIGGMRWSDLKPGKAPGSVGSEGEETEARGGLRVIKGGRR